MYCQIESKLTILFEAPFWIGLYEREYESKYEACRITFGAEPTDCEVYEFMLRNWNQLIFSPSIPVLSTVKKAINPKRQQRTIHRMIKEAPIGTKAQQALKLQMEEAKQIRKTHSRQQNAADKERQFELRQQKRKEKHRGH